MLRVKLGAVAGFEIDIDHKETTIVLAHGGEQGGFTIGGLTGMEASPAHGFNGNSKITNLKGHNE